MTPLMPPKAPGNMKMYQQKDMKPNHGRISLFAFPRVGRSEIAPYMIAKRNDPQNMNSGVWFGPRLGKVHKRDVYLYDVPQDYSARDLLYPDVPEPQGTRHIHYTPRLGRESDEEFEENEEQSSEP